MLNATQKDQLLALFRQRLDALREQRGEDVFTHRSGMGPTGCPAEVLAVLREHFPGLAAEFKLSSLQLFGSFATDEATASSDVDLLTADGIKENRRPFLISSLVYGAL